MTAPRQLNPGNPFARMSATNAATVSVNNQPTMNIQKQIPALALLTTLLFSACSPPRLPPPEDRAPLTPDQQKVALERGKAIAAETFGLLSSNLQSALASGGVTNALPFCSLAASPLTGTVASRHGVTLRRITHKPRNPAARAIGPEQFILESFSSALTSGQSLTLLVTNLIPGHATFVAPIVLTNALCLKCHGQPGKDVAPENMAVIQRHYPQDEATGFKLGDLRGAWRIDFPLTSLSAPAKASGPQ